MQNSCVAIIPARGGSKRIPRKNIKDFFGKPLIAYSIEVALKSKLFDKVIVSTDDEEIAKIAIKYGASVPFLRPKELSDDFTGTGAVVNHTLEYLKSIGENYDFVCTIYATAPFLDEKYLIEGFEKLNNSNAKNAFSCTSMPFPIQRTFKITQDERCEMFWSENFTKRSQDLEEAYQDAGQFYWTNLNIKSDEIIFGKDSIPIILPRHLVQDIDTLEDWTRAEFMFELLLKSKNQKSKMNILIRADSSSFIGTGHIMRDLVLAKQYKAENIIFAVRELDGNINYKIDEEDYSKVILQTNYFKELDKIIKELNIDMIIIDHYEINYDFEKKLKELNTNLKIFVFDDTYEKHFCDILLNHNISANEKRYENLVPNDCELRCGSKYTLLRDEFLEVKKQNNSIKKDKKNKTIFIAMGGADHSNINIDILKVVNKIRKENKKNIKVNIVSTNANKNLEKLKDYCKNKKWINLHINSKQIAKLMSESDFAIVTPSVTVNEAYYLNLPIIAIKTAENQIDMYEFLKKHKYPVLNKFKKEKLKKALKKLLKEK